MIFYHFYLDFFMTLRAVLASLPLPMPLILVPALPLPMPHNLTPALPLPMPLKPAPLLSLPMPLNFAPTLLLPMPLNLTLALPLHLPLYCPCPCTCPCPWKWIQFLRLFSGRREPPLLVKQLRDKKFCCSQLNLEYGYFFIFSFLQFLCKFIISSHFW